MHLGEHAPTGFGDLVEQIEVAAPDFRCLAVGEHPPGHRHPRLQGQCLEALLVVVHPQRIPAGRLGGDLEHPEAGTPHGVDEGPDFLPRRHPACHGLVVGGLMVRGTRGREADCAGPYRFLDDACHAQDVILGGLLLEGARTHDVGA